MHVVEARVYINLVDHSAQFRVLTFKQLCKDFMVPFIILLY